MKGAEATSLTHLGLLNYIYSAEHYQQSLRFLQNFENRYRDSWGDRFAALLNSLQVKLDESRSLIIKRNTEIVLTFPRLPCYPLSCPDELL